jgi:hypothetical protein
MAFLYNLNMAQQHIRRSFIMEMPDRKQLAQVIKEAIEKHYGGTRRRR